MTEVIITRRATINQIKELLNFMEKQETNDKIVNTEIEMIIDNEAITLDIDIDGNITFFN